MLEKLKNVFSKVDAKLRETQTRKLKPVAVFAVSFALVGIYFLTFGRATTPYGEIPTGADQMVLRYDAIHLEVPPNVGEYADLHQPAMVLYGNGLMICTNSDESTDTTTMTQRTLSRSQISDVYSQVRALGFDNLANQDLSFAEHKPYGTVPTVTLNTTIGYRSTNIGDNDTADMKKITDYLDAECAKANTEYDADDITVQAIPSSSNAHKKFKDLPSSAIKSEGTPERVILTRLKGSEAANVKSAFNRSKSSEQSFKNKQKKLVRVRYNVNVPEYQSTQPVSVAKTGDNIVSASESDLKVKFLFVIAKDQAIPSNASTYLNNFASGVSSYYKKQTGKAFTTDQIQVVRGTKTVAEYTTCPAGEDCYVYPGDTSTIKWSASYLNLGNEFKQDGYMVHTWYSWDMGWYCAGLGGFSGVPEKPRWGFVAQNVSGNYCGPNIPIVNGVGAHEMGHGFSLKHTSDGSLMDTVADASQGFNLALNSAHAAFLRDRSAYFNTLGPTVIFTTNTSSIVSGSSATLSWSSTKASSCSASGGWTGGKSLSGSQAVKPTSTTTYKLTCTNSFGSASASVSITVTAQPPPPPPPPPPPSNSDFTPLKPARLLDSRPGGVTIDGSYAAIGTRSAGSTTALKVTSRGGVASTAKAVSLNITAAAPASNGFITVYPCGTSLPNPLTSVLNYRKGVAIAGNVIAKVGTYGRVCVYTNQAIHLIVDVGGYMPSSSTYQTLNSARLLDTRPGGNTVDGKYRAIGTRSGGATTIVQVRGRGGVPSTAKAASLTVTAINPSARGYLSVYPCGESSTTSSLNYAFSGHTIANTVLVKLDSSGRVCITNSTSASLHIALDVHGTFTTSSALTTFKPARLIDTRGGVTVDGQYRTGGLRPAGSTTKVKVAGRGGVPTTALAVALNTTSVSSTINGFLTVYPCKDGRPTASNLNFVAGQAIANGSLTKIDSDGYICIYNHQPSYLLMDVTAAFPAN